MLIHETVLPCSEFELVTILEKAEALNKDSRNVNKREIRFYKVLFENRKNETKNAESGKAQAKNAELELTEEEIIALQLYTGRQTSLLVPSTF